MKRFMSKNTWIGLAISTAVLLIGLASGATLLHRDILPEEAQGLYLPLLGALASFGGAFYAARGVENHLLRALTVCAMLYLLLWIATICVEGPLCFDKSAVKLTAALWSGGVLAGIIAPRKNKKRRTKSGRKPVVKRKKRAVT